MKDSVRTCIGCGREFNKTGHNSRCSPCRTIWERGWRERRKQEGRPVNTNSMPLEYHREYGKSYNSKPEVKKRRAERERKRRKDKSQIHKISARLAVRNAIRRGELIRKPCEKCGGIKVDAHHDDYSRPLDVRWLCRIHHIEIHKAL